MNIVTTIPTTANVTPEVAGRRLFLAGAFWMEPETAHVCDDGHVYLVPILETGPACYCREFMQWGICAHSECILNATGNAEPVDME